MPGVDLEFLKASRPHAIDDIKLYIWASVTSQFACAPVRKAGAWIETGNNDDRQIPN
jgi:hypothetical protein